MNFWKIEKLVVSGLCRADERDELRTKLDKHTRQCTATWLSDEVRTPSLIQERVGEISERRVSWGPYT